MKILPALLCCLLLPSMAGAAPMERIYKVDSVIASLKGRTLTVQARGAVQSGGWTAPHLRTMRGAPHTVILNFVAMPPPPGTPVIEGLLPIAARTVLKVRPGMAAVEVQSDANTITTQILH